MSDIAAAFERLGNIEIEHARYKKALEAIAGGLFEDAGNLAIAGAWQTMYGKLQAMAKSALTDINPEG